MLFELVHAGETLNNDDEIRFWNQRGGQQWRAHQSRYDTLFKRVSESLLAHANLRPGETVFDIGCGNGDTTATLAHAVGPSGQVVAVDVSDPLLDDARDRFCKLRLDNVTVVNADAQTARFEWQADAIVSRFGVMFFGDPVSAFTNLRNHCRDGGRLAFVAWGEQEDNPWLNWAFEVAVDVLGTVPPRDPRRPGPTALGDTRYVHTLLEAAGWQNIEVRYEATTLSIAGDAQHAARFAATLGPVSRVYKYHPPSETQKREIVNRLVTQFSTCQRDSGLDIPARVLVVTARNRGS